MSGNQFSRVLSRWGKLVTLYRPGSETGEVGRAIIQPVPERRERGGQFVPTPLGLMRAECFLYLGDAALSLEDCDGGYLLCAGTAYGISSAQAVPLGEGMSHWRAVLTIRDEVGL